MRRLKLIWIVLCLVLFSGRCMGQSCFSTHEVRVPVAQGDTAKGFLFIPMGARPAGGYPAVLLLHDHGAYFRLGAEKFMDSTWTAKFYEAQCLPHLLAAEGYVVLSIDARYWGSRQSELTQPQYYDSLDGQWFNLILQDDQACIDYLCQMPEVNPRRIAACGFSMGAYRAWQLTAADRRIRVCCAANWMTTLALNRRNDSWCAMRRPEMDEREFYDIASRIYPRAFLLQYGLQDHLFPLAGVDTCVSHIRHAYRYRPSRFCVRSYDGKHRFTRQHMVDWLDFLKKHL